MSLLDTRLPWLFWPIEWGKCHHMISKVNPWKVIQIPPCSLELITKRPSHCGEAHTPTCEWITQKGLETTRGDREARLAPAAHSAAFQAPFTTSLQRPDTLPICAFLQFPPAKTMRDDQTVTVVLSHGVLKTGVNCSKALETGKLTTHPAFPYYYRHLRSGPPLYLAQWLARQRPNQHFWLNESQFHENSSVGKSRILNLVRPEFCDKRFLPALWNCWSLTQMTQELGWDRYMPPSELKPRKGKGFFKNEHYQVPKQWCA